MTYNPTQALATVDEGYALCDSEDYREGLRAFLAKEKPAFRGR